jgi:hypothetical protein
MIAAMLLQIDDFFGQILLLNCEVNFEKEFGKACIFTEIKKNHHFYETQQIEKLNHGIC